MKKLVVKRRIDLGRSNIRTFNGENDFVLDPSIYKEIDVEAPIRKDIADPYNDFIILAANVTQIVGRRFVKGQAMSAFKAIATQADNQDLKVDQESSYINFAYTVARAVVDEMDKQADMFSYKEQALTDIGVCVPTAEHFSQNGEKMKEKLAGEYIVHFPVLDKSISFKCTTDSLVIAPEGPVALTPAFDSEQADTLDSEIGVIIDVGYGSTDITLVIQGEPQGDTARSFPYGGITVESAVASALERDGYSSSASSVKMAITRGYVKSGTNIQAVDNLVATCKTKLAQKLKQSVTSVLAESFYQASDLSYYFPTGRNFKTVDTSKPDYKDAGCLATEFEKAWGKRLEKINTVEVKPEWKCVDRTAPMRDGVYPTIPVDLYELANVYGLSSILDCNDFQDEDALEDEDYSEDVCEEVAEDVEELEPANSEVI